MSKTLKAASSAAIAIYMIATLAMTDTSAAFATPGQVESFIPQAATEAVETAKVSDVAAQAAADIAEAAPIATSLAQLVQTHSVSSDLDSETRCLASAVYHEAKGESLEGQLAVAKVVLARRDSGRFRDTVCGVVRQPGQFSFVRRGHIPQPRISTQAWRNASAIARIALADHWKSPVEGALFFHANHVSPGWRLTRMAAVDNHIFYR